MKSAFSTEVCLKGILVGAAIKSNFSFNIYFCWPETPKTDDQGDSSNSILSSPLYYNIFSQPTNQPTDVCIFDTHFERLSCVFIVKPYYMVVYDKDFITFE